MILDWLTAGLEQAFAHDSRPRILLWCDAQGEFAAIAPALADRLAAQGIALLAFDPAVQHGALWLKWAAEMGPGAGKKVILWLPYGVGDLAEGAPDDTRLVWRLGDWPATLLGFLEHNGMPVTHCAAPARTAQSLAPAAYSLRVSLSTVRNLSCGGIPPYWIGAL